ncbi:MAG: hypothetical protein NUV80_04755 [Candidatus Berkelbacteria bacterium]|nr:hypothetical protein [Candidatus Berkelbacteria bacterium]MCR4307850.1 hypothetical protein [Candidatus Berkelbacteria bacterium]
MAEKRVEWTAVVAGLLSATIGSLIGVKITSLLFADQSSQSLFSVILTVVLSVIPALMFSFMMFQQSPAIKATQSQLVRGFFGGNKTIFRVVSIVSVGLLFLIVLNREKLNGLQYYGDLLAFALICAVIIVIMVITQLVIDWKAKGPVVEKTAIETAIFTQGLSPMTIFTILGFVIGLFVSLILNGERLFSY